MTNDQLGEFVDWVEESGFEFNVWKSEGQWAARVWAIAPPAACLGATPREAIAALAAQVMPKPQCCGVCIYWQRPEDQPYPVGDCTAPIPFSLTATHQVRTGREQGTKCPAFQRRPA